MKELLRGFRTPGAHRCLQDSYALVGSILPNHLNMLKIMLWGALLVAISLLNTQINFYQNWIKILYDDIWAYAPNMIDFGP